MRYFWPIFIVFLFCFDYTNGVYWPPWAALMVGAILCVSAHFTFFKEKVPISFGVLFGYVMLSGVFWSHWRPLTMLLEFDQKAAIRCASLEAAFQFATLALLFYTLWPKIRDPIAKGIYFGGLFHTLWLIFDQVAPRFMGMSELFSTIGLLGNRSIGASFAAVWFFFAIYTTTKYARIWSEPKYRKLVFYSAFLAIPAIALSVSSISFGALIVGGIAAFIGATPIAIRDVGPKAKYLMAGCTILLIGSAALFGPMIDPEWYHHISRFDAWPMFFNFFDANGFLTSGSGVGTFKFYGPLIQEGNKYMIGRWWLWAHNDWLQILFELGIWGLWAAGWAYFTILMKSWRQPMLFASTICYGAVMCGNYPLHIAMFALFGWWLAFESIWGWPEAVMSNFKEERAKYEHQHVSN